MKRMIKGGVDVVVVVAVVVVVLLLLCCFCYGVVVMEDYLCDLGS